MLTYLYCIVPAASPLQLADIEPMDHGHSLQTLAVGSLQAVFSQVGAEFDEATLNAGLADLEWLSPRAVRHHNVIDRVFAQCKVVVPLGFGTVFRDPSSLRSRLEDQSQRLERVLAYLQRKEEWSLKVTLDERALEAAFAGESASLGRLEQDIANSQPGTRYLLQRRLDQLRRTEAGRFTGEALARIQGTIAGFADDTRRDQLTEDQSNTARLILRAAYLIEEHRVDAMKLAAQQLAADYGRLGFTFDLNGPWPAFSFVGGAAETMH